MADDSGFSLACQMQDSGNIQCPFCGQTFTLAVDTTQAEQVFTVDCEICCRPMEVSVRCEAGEILDLEVRGD
jgi:transcription elongation factor Elf1